MCLTLTAGDALTAANVACGNEARWGARRRGSRVHRLAALALATLCGVGWPPGAADGDVTGGAGHPRSPHRHVLILHSYHQGYRFTDQEMAGMDAVLRPEVGWVEPHVVYLDAKRAPLPGRGDALVPLLQLQFARTPVDAVLAADNDALAFALRHRPALFPGRPIVFCGINDFTDRILTGHKNVTGVVEAADLHATIAVALRLRPAARRVVVITDGTTMGAAYDVELQHLADQFVGRAAFEFLRLGHLTMDELLAHITALPSDAILLVVQAARDRAGRSFSPEASMALFARHAAVPMFLVNETWLGWARSAATS